MDMYQEPSLLGTTKIREPHGEEIGLMFPFSNNYASYLLISSFSIIDYWYHLELGNESPVSISIIYDMYLSYGKPLDDLKTSLKYAKICLTYFSFTLWSIIETISPWVSTWDSQYPPLTMIRKNFINLFACALFTKIYGSLVVGTMWMEKVSSPLIRDDSGLIIM